MIDEKGIDEQMIKMKAGKFFTLIATIVIATNSMTLTYQKITQNEEKATYDRERAQRYADRKAEEVKDHHYIESMKNELDKCKNGE